MVKLFLCSEKAPACGFFPFMCLCPKCCRTMKEAVVNKVWGGIKVSSHDNIKHVHVPNTHAQRAAPSLQRKFHMCLSVRSLCNNAGASPHIVLFGDILGTSPLRRGIRRKNIQNFGHMSKLSYLPSTLVWTKISLDKYSYCLPYLYLSKKFVLKRISSYFC